MTLKRHTPQPLAKDRLATLREIIRDETWKKASSKTYENAPHSYLIAYNYPKPEPPAVSLWKFFSDAIRDCGDYRTWHGHRYKYLIIDSYAYWVDFPALNRAKADTLDPKDFKPEF